MLPIPDFYACALQEAAGDGSPAWEPENHLVDPDGILGSQLPNCPDVG